MSTKMTLSEFEVALQDLSDAAHAVGTQAQTIQTQSEVITKSFQQVDSPAVWSGPAATSFVELQAAVTAALGNLNTLLTEMVSRMQTAYQNYHDAELANFNNYSTKGK